MHTYEFCNQKNITVSLPLNSTLHISAVAPYNVLGVVYSFEYTPIRFLAAFFPFPHLIVLSTPATFPHRLSCFDPPFSLRAAIASTIILANGG